MNTSENYECDLCGKVGRVVWIGPKRTGYGWALAVCGQCLIKANDSYRACAKFGAVCPEPEKGSIE